MQFSGTNLHIEHFQLGSLANNCFLIYNLESQEAILIDAPVSSWDTIQPILEKHNLTLTALWLTHGHWDHIVDAHLFKNANIPTCLHPDDKLFLESPELMRAFVGPSLSLTGITPDHDLDTTEPLQALGYTWEVRHVPGHSPGSVLFYLPEAKTAFSGDLVFMGSIGRFDLPGADYHTLEKSILTQLYTLPDDTILWPGHGPDTQVGHERRTNPFIQAA